MHHLPDAMRQSFLNLERLRNEVADLYRREALYWIYGAAGLCGTAALVPVPYLDIPVVLSIQAGMIQRVASVYGQSLSVQNAIETLTAVGGTVLVRMLLRELVKLIPYVGSAVNAAAASLMTLALGEACCFYYGRIREGHVPSREEFARVFQEQLSQLQRGNWKKSGEGHP